MHQKGSLGRRALARIGIGVGAAVAALLALPAVAAAHVTVQPDAVEGGGFSVVSFRVPNERDDASTTQLQVTLPRDQPIGSVQTTSMPGWKITTATRKLDKPIEMFGEQVDTVVSEVTWTATDGGIRPGQFQDFNLSLGQLPETGELVFNTLQTYSSGEQVNWNQVSTDPAVEPDHPAPILKINSSPTSQDEQVAATAQSDSGPEATLALVLSGAALVLSLATALLAWRRDRRPASVGKPASEPAREDVKV